MLLLCKEHEEARDEGPFPFAKRNGHLEPILNLTPEPHSFAYRLESRALGVRSILSE